MRLLTRRTFLTGSAVAAAGAFAVGGYATIFEPTHPKLTRVDIFLSRLPEAWDGFRIVQLSDFHYDDYFCVIPIRSAVATVNQLQPDLVLLTGDFVTVPIWAEYLHSAKKAAEDAEPCAQLLSQLRALGGVIAALGNHDVASDSHRIVEALQFHGIPVLRNSAVALARGASRLWLAGIDDALEGKPDLDQTLKGIPREEPVILMAHEPDFADDVAKYPVDLQLSGHSHGGQVRLPLVGALYLPEMAEKYSRGLYKVGPLTLYTNSGIGTIRAPVRFNCPPEITLFTLRAEARRRPK